MTSDLGLGGTKSASGVDSWRSLRDFLIPELRLGPGAAIAQRLSSQHIGQLLQRHGDPALSTLREGRDSNPMNHNADDKVLTRFRMLTNAKAAKLVFRTVLSLLVSGVFVWLSLRHTDLEAVVHAITSAAALPLLGYLGILLAVHLVRTVRWGLLLEPLGHVGFKRVNSASAIGYMMLMLLPLRLGELARPLLVARTATGEGPQLRRSGAMAACVVERVVDGLAIGVMGIVALHLLGAGASGRMADYARHATSVVTAAFAGLCLALILAFVMRKQTTILLRQGLGRLAPRIAERAASILEGFITALNLGSGLRLLAVLALTVVHWGLHVVGFAMLAPAFGMHLTALMACTVLAAQAVGVMVPAGPGMIGTSQFFTQAGLSIFVPGALTIPEVAARAAGYANSIWMLQFGQQVCLGLLFWFADRTSLAGLLGARASDAVLRRELNAESSGAV
jgi:uncharacterized membrane protein YbhN (UPF0104 family)